MRWLIIQWHFEMSSSEKLDSSVDLFQLMAAIDRKEYYYYDKLTPEQQKGVALFNMVRWISSISGKSDLQDFYLQSVNYHANVHMVNSVVAKHPSLQWMMLCASSPGRGVQRHIWIPQLKTSHVALKVPVPLAEAKAYFKKIYPTASDKDLGELSKEFVHENKRKVHLAKIYPNLKISDLEVLNTLVTDEELKQYERDLGS